MRIEYRLLKKTPADSATSALLPNGSPRPSRIARLIALAHKLERMVQTGEVRDYRELARVGQISDSRLSQILILAQLAPAIQEHFLFASPLDDMSISERELREIARAVRWDRQAARCAQIRR
jgi:hypothetical protein